MTDAKQKRALTFDQVAIHIGGGAEELFARAQKIEEVAAEALRDRAFTAYAAPSAWGPDVTVASHLGIVTYTISYDAVGDTLVMGRVTYWKGPAAGTQVTEEFRDSTTITTANAVANVECAFKGIPTGSAVTGTCNP